MPLLLFAKKSNLGCKCMQGERTSTGQATLLVAYSECPSHLNRRLHVAKEPVLLCQQTLVMCFCRSRGKAK
jgi:hypothetical protein